MLEQVLALALFGEDLFDLRDQFSWGDQFPQMDVRMCGFNKFSQLAPRLRERCDLADLGTLTRRVNGLLNIVCEQVVSSFSLTSSDLQRYRIEIVVITGCVATHHRSNVLPKPSHNAPRFPRSILTSISSILLG